MTSESPLPLPLSARFTTSFAYPTMKDRIPVILSRVIDSLNRNKDNIMQEYGGEAAREELKAVIGSLSQLRYEVMTNKPAASLRDSRPDASAWNLQLAKEVQNHGAPMAWFDSAWLWMECYLYRRIQETTGLCTILKQFDVFAEQKKAALLDSNVPISVLTMHLLEVIQSLAQSPSDAEVDRFFADFLQISLWGNKCDLSISSGQGNHQEINPLEQLTTLKPKLLIDDTNDILRALRQAGNAKAGQGARVDIVLDNAGFELVTDLCLAQFLISSGLASKVHFHAKAMPWFVSDVTVSDFNWTMKDFSMRNHIALSQLVPKWKSYLRDGSWVLEANEFWTMPQDYALMQEDCASLYSHLSQSDLIVFKGDLNYRKLVGDLSWDFTTSFLTSLRGFCPAPLCSLRTLKCDTVVGLRPGQGKEVQQKDIDWMIKGDWAVISFTDGKE